MCWKLQFCALLLLKTQRCAPQMESCRDRELERFWHDTIFGVKESAGFLTCESSLKENNWKKKCNAKTFCEQNKSKKKKSLNFKNRKHLIVQNRQKILSGKRSQKLVLRHLCITSPFPHSLFVFLLPPARSLYHSTFTIVQRIRWLPQRVIFLFAC